MFRSHQIRRDDRFCGGFKYRGDIWNSCRHQIWPARQRTVEPTGQSDATNRRDIWRIHGSRKRHQMLTISELVENLIIYPITHTLFIIASSELDVNAFTNVSNNLYKTFLQHTL